jgi:hypothetical protein
MQGRAAGLDRQQFYASRPRRAQQMVRGCIRRHHHGVIDDPATAVDKVLQLHRGQRPGIVAHQRAIAGFAAPSGKVVARRIRAEHEERGADIAVRQRIEQSGALRADIRLGGEDFGPGIGAGQSDAAIARTGADFQNAPRREGDFEAAWRQREGGDGGGGIRRAGPQPEWIRPLRHAHLHQAGDSGGGGGNFLGARRFRRRRRSGGHHRRASTRHHRLANFQNLREILPGFRRQFSLPACQAHAKAAFAVAAR